MFTEQFSSWIHQLFAWYIHKIVLSRWINYPATGTNRVRQKHTGARQQTPTPKFHYQIGFLFCWSPRVDCLWNCVCVRARACERERDSCEKGWASVCRYSIKTKTTGRNRHHNICLFWVDDGNASVCKCEMKQPNEKRTEGILYRVSTWKENPPLTNKIQVHRQFRSYYKYDVWV